MNGYNIILLDRPPFFREIDSSTRSRDASSFSFVIEELISYGVVDIAIPKTSLSIYALDLLPTPFKERINIIDKKNSILEKALSLSSSILNEFGLKLDGYSAIRIEKKINNELEHALINVHSAIYPFLLGIEHRLQIELDIDSVRNSISIIRNHCKNKKLIPTLVTFLGVFSTYQKQNLDSIAMKSVAPERLTDIFGKFIDDVYYKQMSSEFRSIGFPTLLEKSKINIARISKKIFQKPLFKQFINLTTKTISAATQVPLPDSELGEALITKNYFPPTIDLSKAIDKAKKSWEKAGPDYIKLVDYSQ